MVAYLESSEDQLEVISLPGCIVHHRIIEANSIEGIDRNVNDFTWAVVKAGGSIYKISRWNGPRWAFVVVYYHSHDVEMPWLPSGATERQFLEEMDYQEDLMDVAQQAQRMWGIDGKEGAPISSLTILVLLSSRSPEPSGLPRRVRRQTSGRRARSDFLARRGTRSLMST